MTPDHIDQLKCIIIATDKIFVKNMIIFKWFTTIILVFFLGACVQVKENSAFLKQSTNQTVTYSTSTLILETEVEITPLTPSLSNFIPTTYSINPQLGSGLSFDNSSGTISGTPNATMAETIFTITANNSEKNLTSSIKITIVPFNNPSVTQNFNSLNLNEDSESIIQLNYSDQDGDLATSCSLTNLSHVTITSPCTCLLGICSVGVKGTLNYYGSGSFSYSVSDGKKSSNTSITTFTINAVDDPPIGQNNTVAMTEDTSSTINLDYSDLEGDQATSCSVSELNHLNPDPTCTCTSGVCSVLVAPSSNYYGAASFKYSVTTNSLTSVSKLVSLNIASVDDAPIGTLINDSTDEDIEKIVTLNYSDVDGDIASACNLTQLTHLSVTTPCSCLAGICQVGVTGELNYNGQGQFQFSVEANGLSSLPTVATIDIRSVNDSPKIELSSSSIVTTIGQTTSNISLQVSDIDNSLACDSTNLAFQSSDQSILRDSGITISGTSPNCFLAVTPLVTENSTSEVIITITLNDGAGQSSSSGLNIVVNPLPLTTLACKDIVSTYLRDNSLKPVVSNDGSSLSYSIDNPLPDGLTIDLSTGIISGQPNKIEAPQPYNLTASNSISSGTCSFTLESKEIAPSGLTLYNTSSLIFDNYKGKLSTVEGSPATNYKIFSGNLPDGLSLDESTGKISGIAKSGVMNYPNEIFIESSNGAGSSIEKIKLNLKFNEVEFWIPRPLNLFNKNFSSDLAQTDSLLLINEATILALKIDPEKEGFLKPSEKYHWNSNANFVDAVAYDFSDDGYDELILADSLKQEILVWTMKDGKDFHPYSLEAHLPIEKFTRLFPWDVNNDGLKDLLYISSTGGQIYFSVYFNTSNNGKISFKSPIVIKPQYESQAVYSNSQEKPFAATVYDFNQDSVDDLALMANDSIYYFDHESFNKDDNQIYSYAHSKIILNDFPYSDNLKMKPFDFNNDGLLDLEIISKNYIYWVNTKPKTDTDLSHVLDQLVKNNLFQLQIIETDYIDTNNDGKKEYLSYVYGAERKHLVLVSSIHPETYTIKTYNKLPLPDYPPNDVINAPIWAHFDGLELYDKDLYEGSMILWHDKIDFFNVKIKAPK
jgi:hypothetical protein